MNSVKKTPVVFRWRLSASTLLQRRDRERDKGVEEEVKEGGLTVEGEKCFPSCRLAAYVFLHWLVSFVKA